MPAPSSSVRSLFFSISALIVLDVPGPVAAFFFLDLLRSFYSFVSLSHVSVQHVPPSDIRLVFGIYL